MEELACVYPSHFLSTCERDENRFDAKSERCSFWKIVQASGSVRERDGYGHGLDQRVVVHVDDVPA